jgi:hypothetical protein
VQQLIKKQQIIMADNKNNPTSKRIAMLLGLVLIAGAGLFYVFYTKSVDTENKLNAQKNEMIANLSKSRDSIAIVITENSSIKSELLVEQQKITNLIDELSASNATIEELTKYKAEVVKLRKQVAVLKNDKMELVQKYEALKNKQDSTAYVLENTIKSKDKLEEMNIDMNKMVKKSSRVSFVNLKTETLKQGRSGGSIVTNVASKVNILKISFMVIGNKLTNPVEKEYYVQIIDSKNNIMGDKLSKKFGPMILDYSYASKFKYVNENLEVNNDLELENLEKGTYFVNIFDRDQLALKTSFVLK